MKKYVLVFLIFASQMSLADNYVDILPLQLQYRYEDTVNQSKDYLSYQSFGAAIQVEKFRLGIDAAIRKDSTGNASLNIETKKKDFLLSVGYQVYLIQNKDSIWHVGLFANGIAGVSETEVKTNLLGSSSSSVGDQNPVFGLGAAAVFRVKYFVLEADVKALNSKGFSPSTVFSSQLKLGLTIPI
ncbi:MAG: hypothetical protein H7256_16570 [Bdellovibrio sp.]|nr:hypothetical protein [Bdellovibrio sp.]